MVVVDRHIEVWPSIKLIMDFLEKLQKLKQPSNKSYNTLKTSASDELVIGKLVCFSYVTGMVKPFLAAFETDSRMTPFLFGDLFKLLKTFFFQLSSDQM